MVCPVGAVKRAGCMKSLQRGWRIDKGREKNLLLLVHRSRNAVSTDRRCGSVVPYGLARIREPLSEDRFPTSLNFLFNSTTSGYFSVPERGKGHLGTKSRSRALLVISLTRLGRSAPPVRARGDTEDVRKRLKADMPYVRTWPYRLKYGLSSMPSGMIGQISLWRAKCRPGTSSRREVPAALRSLANN